MGVNYRNVWFCEWIWVKIWFQTKNQEIYLFFQYFSTFTAMD